MAPASHDDFQSASPNAGSRTGAESGTNASDIAQAYKDLTRGEQAATALEANLSKLESRLDELLAGFEDDQAHPEVGSAVANADAGQGQQKAQSPKQEGEKPSAKE